MKKMKRLAALFLAVVMIMAMGMTAMAEETTPAEPAETTKTITINNPLEDVDYTAYKIFTATVGNGHIAYKLDNTSAAYTALKNLAEVADKGESNGVKIIKTPVDGIYNVEVTSAPKFAAYLKNLKENNGFESTAAGILAENGVITVSADGYYFIDNTTAGSLANMNEVSGNNITIYDKNEEPDITKTTTVSSSVEVGQSIPYTVSGNVPSTVGYEKYDYIVSDTMGEALTFNNDIVVKVGGVVIYDYEADPAYTGPVDGLKVDITKNATNKPVGFVLNFDMTKFTAEEIMEVTYTATVNEKAVMTETSEDGLKNKVKLIYSNDPANSDDKKESTEKEVPLYTSNIIIDKVDGGSKNQAGEYTTRLNGAEFVLVSDKDAVEDTETKEVTLSANATYYKYTAATGTAEAKVEWVGKDGATVKATKEVDGNNGVASFEGLKDGTYYLVETKAPDGYNLMTSPKKVEVTHGEGRLTLVSQPVENNSGSTLPSTGGIGTTIFYVVGGIMVLGAGVLLITKKRMSAK